MLMRNECAVCILNQIIRAGMYMELDEKTADAVFSEALKKTLNTDYRSLTPPVFSGMIYESILHITGNGDPYKALRKEQNDLVLDSIGLFRERIEGSGDPLHASLLYSLLGNIIDYGGVEIFDTGQIFEGVKDIRLAVNDYDRLRSGLETARSVLVISDNAGEAVFDMLFLEQVRRAYPGAVLRYAVRSGPAINDVIREDAEYIGIDRIAEIVETGSAFAGTMIALSDPRFLELYTNADVVISKGQGNFETLEMETEKDIFFVFKVKCSVVAAHAGLPLNSLVLGYRRSF